MKVVTHKSSIEAQVQDPLSTNGVNSFLLCGYLTNRTRFHYSTITARKSFFNSDSDVQDKSLGKKNNTLSSLSFPDSTVLLQSKSLETTINTCKRLCPQLATFWSSGLGEVLKENLFGKLYGSGGVKGTTSSRKVAKAKRNAFSMSSAAITGY